MRTQRPQESRVRYSFPSGQSGRSPTRMISRQTGRRRSAMSVPRRSASCSDHTPASLTIRSLAQISPTLTRVTVVLHRLPAKVKRPFSQLLGGFSPPTTKRKRRGLPAISVVDARPIGLDRARALESACSSTMGTLRPASNPRTPSPDQLPVSAGAEPQSGNIQAKGSLSRSSSVKTPTWQDAGRLASSPPPSRLSHEPKTELPHPPSRARSVERYPPFHTSHAALHLRIRSQQSLAMTASSSSCRRGNSLRRRQPSPIGETNAGSHRTAATRLLALLPLVVEVENTGT